MSASSIVQLFLILGLLFSSIGGLVVASILKKLDNVVKVNIYRILTLISISPSVISSTKSLIVPIEPVRSSKKYMSTGVSFFFASISITFFLCSVSA